MFSMFQPALVCLALSVMFVSPGATEEPKTESKPLDEQSPTAESEAARYMEEIKNRYSEMTSLAKKHGDVPQEALDWFKQDIQNISTWDYKILELSLSDGEKAEHELNQLGAERWEVIAAITTSQGERVLLKRARKSYLKSLPVKDILRLMQNDGNE
jgi:hypothetical protein